MKPALLTAFARMLPRLQAEEDLRLVGVVAAGTGSMKRHNLTGFLRDLTRQARSARTERAQPVSSAELAAIGIRVVEVPKTVTT